MVKEMTSAIGPANNIPSSPNANGIRTTSGIKSNTCLERESITPINGLPIAAKKLDDIICIPTHTSIDKKMRINFSENSK